MTSNETDRKDQRTVGQCAVGDEIGPTSIDLGLQKLVMIAAANRDFAPLHHDPDMARASGAPTASVNVMFVMALMERALLEWGGLRTRIQKLGPFRMTNFSSAGDRVSCRGRVTEVDEKCGRVRAEMWFETSPEKRTVVGEAEVQLPK